MPDFAIQALRNNFLVYKIEKGSDFCGKEMLSPANDYYCIQLILTPHTPAIEKPAIPHITSEATMCFASPGQFIPCAGGAESYGYAIHFKRDFLSIGNLNNRILHDFSFFRHGVSPMLILSLAHQSVIIEVCEIMLHEYTHSNAQSLPLIRAYLNVLLYQSQRIYRQQHESMKQPEPVSPRTLSLSLNFQELVSKHICHYKSVEDYARMLDVSPKHLSVVVKQTLDKNASQVIQETLIQEAKKLLVHTDHSITRLAGQLGFKEQSHFNKFFKKHTRQTPLQYRLSYFPTEEQHVSRQSWVWS